MKVFYLTNLPVPYRRQFFNELGKLCDLFVVYESGSSDSSRNKNWVDKNRYNFHEMALKNNSADTFFEPCSKITQMFRQFDRIVIGGYSSIVEMKAICFLKKNKIPFVISSDGGFIKKDTCFKFLLKSKLLSSASLWMSSGNETSHYLTYYGARSKDIFLYHFTSLKKEDILSKPVPVSKKKELKLRLGVTEKTMAVFVGQFIPRKGLDLLVKAGKGLLNIGFYLIGSDNHDKKYSKKCRQTFGKNFHEIPFLTKNELNEYYEAADFFILPTREDIWGLVINEAMAKGLPIITTTKCLAGLELVNDSNGRLVSPNNADELKKAIIEITSLDLQKMGESSLKKIKNYTFEQMAKDYFEALNKDK